MYYVFLVDKRECYNSHNATMSSQHKLLLHDEKNKDRIMIK